MSQPTGSNTLPRDFQYSQNETNRYRTPEPSSSACQDLAQPSPPPAYRRKIKKRNVPNLSAPTEHFLASVAAADVAVPTIEVPDMDDDVIMLDPLSDLDPGFLSPEPSNMLAKSPPRTPDSRNPTNFDTFGSHRPDWYQFDSPVEEFSRPESSHSDASEHSSDTYFDSIRTSRPSDDGSCTSPESDGTGSFKFPKLTKKPTARGLLSPIEDSLGTSPVLNAQFHRKTRNDALWTKEMNDHLWSVYQVYLQDPTVTPFRILASCVPPEGVCHRVAREARRSWRGGRYVESRSVPRSKADGSSENTSVGSPDTVIASRSNSITPTALPAPKSYIQWPHSGAATRHRLRELCKIQDAKSVQRHHHLQLRSPTPFTKSRLRKRVDIYTPESAKPEPSLKDFSLSLTTSTAESMQPDGPLAKLSRGSETVASNSAAAAGTSNEDHSLSQGLGISVDTLPRRLGSPFMAHTYGPSSSKSLEHLRPTLPPFQLVGSSSSGPTLRSSPCFEPHQSNTTQKRRAQNPPYDEHSFIRHARRPSIADQIFGPTLYDDQRRIRNRGFSMGDEGLHNRHPGLFEPAELLPGTKRPSTGTSVVEDDPFVTPTNPTLLPSATFDYPQRSGIPAEEEAGLRATFPRRLFQPADSTNTGKHRGFATSHFPRHSIDSIDFTREIIPPLQSRLNHLDERLAEIHEREASRKRGRE